MAWLRQIFYVKKRHAAYVIALMLCCLLCVIQLHATSGKELWPPIPPEDLAMKDNPASPGSPAMILNHEQFTDQSNLTNLYEMQYYRIKIFNEQGKHYADIEIPFIKDRSRITDIVARTIHPDGRIVEFAGQVFERTAVKVHGFKYLVKAFTLPEVEPGSVIEYRFVVRWTNSYLAFSQSSHWTLQEDLFMRRSLYTLNPYRGLSLHSRGWTYHGEAVREEQGQIIIEEKNIPAFEQEDFMPPEDDAKPHWNFYYSYGPLEAPDQFWKRIGKEHYEAMEKFLRNSREAASTVSPTISSADPAQAKLRKLYARAQQIRNLNLEREKTEKEEKRDRLKVSKNVDEVLRRGYGQGNEINYAFVALARAAGFDATIVEVAPRAQGSFSRNLLNEYQLNDTVVAVRLGSEDVYLDPATPFCPYGILPWEETASTGLRLERDGGEFITTPAPKTADAEINRRGDLQLDADGNLGGKLVVSFKGTEALRLRVKEANQDETGRHKDIQDEIKSWLPTRANFEMSSVAGWDVSDSPLLVQGKLSMPKFAAAAGHRILLPASIFESKLFHSFSASLRVHPIYFHRPSKVLDQINVRLPTGYRVESLAGNVLSLPGIAEYQIAVKQQPDGFHVERSLMIETVEIEVGGYPGLRTFFSAVKTSDEEEVVIQLEDSTVRH